MRAFPLTSLHVSVGFLLNLWISSYRFIILYNSRVPTACESVLIQTTTTRTDCRSPVYNADYLVEVSDNYMLYKSQSGIWHFESFLSIAQADSSVTVSIPTEALAVNFNGTDDEHGDRRQR